MLKKLIYLILVGIIGYMIFVPMAVEKQKDMFQDAGVSNVSVFDFLKPNQYQDDQNNSTEDES